MNRLKTVGIIPARYQSTRFPGKPLARIAGKPMIQRVYERASLAKLLDDVIVATDDERILGAVKKFGGRAEMTSPQAANGSERIAEVARGLDCDLVVNIQGDEPLIDAEVIDQLVRLMADNADAPVGTLVRKIESAKDLLNPNIVKVVVDKNWYALYFSRAVIPFQRDGAERSEWPRKSVYYWHVGIYIYRRNFLLKFVDLPPSALEKAEQLEQLRMLENGYRLKVALTDKIAMGVDVPEDIAKVERYLKEMNIE
ncbi:MAG: 3-deoxy-manno-octulosonate cytidylyltransferase [Calditrichaeota bacterium]|nr:3-deoxy-manno-octulosonate cytidylyltransferase [Calditrichota bacterium]